MVEIYHLILGWSHILGVIVWLGGAIFIDFVLGPSTGKLDMKTAMEIHRVVMRRFTPIVWTSAIIIGVSGVLRAMYTGVLNEEVLSGSRYGLILQSKMVLYTIMFLVGIGIFLSGRSLGRTSSPEEMKKLVGRIKILSSSNIFFGLLTLLLAVMLRLGG